MDLFADQKIQEFCKRHPSARRAASRWVDVIRTSSFGNHNELHHVFRSADYLVPYTVFNIGGNNFRIITSIDFSHGAVQVLWMLTHAEYDKWTQRYYQQRSKS